MPIIHELLKENYSFEEAELLQVKYCNIIKNLSENTQINTIKIFKTVAGVDISYYIQKNKEYGVACAVLWDIRAEKVITHCFASGGIKFPYKPGFLGFRECRLLSQAIFQLPKRPDLIMCDGHGKIHPKRFGEAVHLGLALNIPSIGIAKNPFIGFSKWNEIEKFKGNKAPIWAKNPKFTLNKNSNELLGYTICLNDYSKPIMISEGYKVTLDTALKVCLNATKGHRQPEPLYLADYLSRNKVKKFVP